MIVQIYVALFATLLLSGCGCKIEKIQPIKPIKSTDIILSCNQIEDEFKIAQYHLEMMKGKRDYAASYAGSPRCLIDTLLKIDLAENSAKERMAYLKMLNNNKKCKTSVS
jgi:intergrase/recombinase